MSLSSDDGPALARRPGAAERRLEAAFRDHGDAVHAYVRYRVGSEAADEIVADTYVAAWRRLDRLTDPLLPWLLGTARKLIGNELRRQRRSGELRRRLAAERETSAGEPVDDDRLRAAIGSLQPDDQDVLIMTYWYDLEPRQAAAALGCSSGAYRVRLHRARQRLRAVVERRDRQGNDD